VIVLTSNLGVAQVSRAKSIGFGNDAAQASDSTAQKTLDAVRATLPPEVYNRLDEVIFFPRLSRAAVGQIAHGMLAGVKALLRREQAIELEIEDSVVDALIAAGGYDPELGARPLRRTMGRELESPIASAVLRGEFARGAKVRVWGEGAKVRLAALPG
jgi:ATP-dependent Clp protease ATP-binding subunit ClpC